MPTAGGPNTLGESNLVFAYDTGDTGNSYKGAPTTNICTGADYSIYNAGATNVRNQTSPLPPVAGYEVVKVTANTPGTYGQSILWTANYSSTPTTATNSVYAWLQSGNYVQVGQHWHPWNYGSPKYIEKGKWVRISETYAINEGGSYGAAAMVYSTDGVAYFCMPQYELKPYQTPFVNFLNSRLATEGLLTLVGTTTINLTNVSFDSSAKIVFDGTNDYINIGVGTGINQFSGDFTVSLWAMRTAGGAYGNLIGDYYTNNTANTGEWQIMMGPSSELNLYKVGPGYVISNISSGFSNNTWINAVVTRSGTTVTMYANSNAIATGTDSTSYGTVTGNLNIGIDGNNSSEPFPGRIDKVKIYNRALTAQEVRQNYQQHKTRFNLS